MKKKTNIKFRYWPFAIDKDQINKNLIANKDYDLFFSGLIFNSNISKNKNNLRLKIFNIIYNNILFLKILKKKNITSLILYGIRLLVKDITIYF